MRGPILLHAFPIAREVLPRYALLVFLLGRPIGLASEELLDLATFARSRLLVGLPLVVLASEVLLVLAVSRGPPPLV